MDRHDTFVVELRDVVTGAKNTARVRFMVIGERATVDVGFQFPPTSSQLAAMTEAIPILSKNWMGVQIDPVGPPERFDVETDAAASNRAFLGGGMG